MTIIAKRLLFILFPLLLLSGCGKSHVSTQAAAIDQTEICVVERWQATSECRTGMKILFVPPSFGNEQLPILFAASNCDLRYTVALTRGAVTCIFSPTGNAAKASEAQQEAPAASAASR